MLYDKGHIENTARGEGLIPTLTRTKPLKGTIYTEVHLAPMHRVKSASPAQSPFYTLRQIGDGDSIQRWCEVGAPKQIYVGTVYRTQYYVRMNSRHEDFYMWGYDECPICGEALYYSHYLTQQAVRTQKQLEVVQ
jgi:hypothetical protein